MNSKISLLLLIFSILAPLTRASTATLTPESRYLHPGGGTVTLTAELADYPGTITAAGWSVSLPTGWSYVSGVNEPGVKPTAGATGTIEWAYVAIPANASFSFTISYPAGIASTLDLASSVIIRAAGTLETVTPAGVTLSPGTIPIITSATAASATFGSSVSYNITATSPLEITGYGATGLPAGLLLDGGTGLISGAPTQLGTFAVVLTAANAAGSATATLTITVSAARTAPTDRTFFGLTNRNSSSTSTTRRTLGLVKVGDIAAWLPANSRTGSLLVVAPDAGINELIGFTLGDDNSFTASATQHIDSTTRLVVCTGQLQGDTFSGVFTGTGLSFTTLLDRGTGGSAAAQGLYISTALKAGTGTTYTVIGASNSMLVLVVTPTLDVGGTAMLQNDGSFTLTTGTATIVGTVNAPANTVSSAITIGTAPPIDFGGRKTTTDRTDRLINLSSRARVDVGEKLLISGFVIGGTEAKAVLVRAVGPGLAPFSVADVLSDPRIQIVRNGSVVAENDNWGSNTNAAAIATTAARIGAFALASGSTDAALLTTLQPGVYSALVSGGTGVAMAEIYDASETPPSDSQRLVNISARGDVSSGDNILIGGLVITGNAPKRVLIRAVGPALASKGVGNPLANPILRVFQRGAQIAENDDWSTDASAATERANAATKTGAFPLPSGSRDAAILLTLEPGLYTVHVTAGPGTAPGIALVEIYEVPE